MYRSTKTFEHFASAAFRQWRAEHSHCHYIHGYGLSVRIEFQATELDENGWVVDFGALKPLKKEMEDIFDHKLVVAADDPKMEFFEEMNELGVIQLVVLPRVGCEAFAKFIYGMADAYLRQMGHHPRVSVASVEVMEHPGNSAIYWEEI